MIRVPAVASLIISHKHKFIFLHARKCAGSSVTAALNHCLGEADIQVGAWADTLELGGELNTHTRQVIYKSHTARFAFLSHLASFNLLTNPRRRVRGGVNHSIKKHWTNILGENPAHASAKSIEDYIPREFSSYTKIAVIRDPKRMELSDYGWRVKRKGIPLSFYDFLLLKLDALDGGKRHNVVPTPVTNWPIYSIDESPVVDRWLRFENLAQDFAVLVNDHQLGCGELGYAKSAKTFIAKKDDYFDVSEREMELILELHRNEYELFEYS